MNKLSEPSEADKVIIEQEKALHGCGKHSDSLSIHIYST